MIRERTLLSELRERVRRIERSRLAIHGVLPFGVAAIDRVLPDGGLARGALHEILGAGGDEEDGALAAAFAAGIVAVIGEVGTLAVVASRRLQLAAERSGITAFLLRRWRDSGQAARERNLPNAVVTRWRIVALPSQPPPIPSPAC